MKKVLTFLLVLVSFFIMQAPMPMAAAAPIEPTYTVEEQQEAAAKVAAILENTEIRKDKVTKVTWYNPKVRSLKDKILWYAGEKDGKIWMRAKIYDFSHYGDSWLFWNRLTFATDEESWEYIVNDVSKDEKTDGRGKYEILDVPFEELEQGYRMFATGTAPVLRLHGVHYYSDYEPKERDIERIKTAITLYEQLKISGQYK